MNDPNPLVTPGEIDQQRDRVTRLLEEAYLGPEPPVDDLLEALTQAVLYVGDCLRRGGGTG